jgi:hypothetical protein
MSGHVSEGEHCAKPNGFFARRRHQRMPWVCDCGKAWLSKRTVDCSWADCITTWSWYEWSPQ